MTTSAFTVCHPASQNLRDRMVYLSQRGVEYAHGRVIVSNDFPGQPPTGHDQVSSGVYAGYQPLTEAEERGIRHLMALEMAMIAQQVLPGDSENASLIVGEYSIAPVDGEAVLTINTYGLADGVARVSLN